ncbi:MAG: type III-B CRISPR-associated protein Cas10/Cmr2 [Deltaproteobacteria bacterium]|nr:type III-B CRISPR-associated protein Cas10/Cmr2 [Deltaproteobacteria bacterium]
MNNTIIEKFKSFFQQHDNLCLLLVSIGPVQEFIAEARKARDLWAGSYILSLATFKAMEPILNKYGKDVIIYPHIEENPFFKLYNGTLVLSDDLQFPTLPNHFLVVVEGLKKNVLMDDACKSVASFWNELSKKAHDFIDSVVNARFKGWNDLWNHQIEDHFQIYWVAEPVKISDIETNYIDIHNRVQGLMEARKLTRTFVQWKGSDSFKCYQCGHREVIGSKGFWGELSKNLNFHFMIKEKEKLCAVCLVKRLTKEGDILKSLKRPPFESTSDISSRPFKNFLGAKNSEPKVQDFLGSINNLCDALGISRLKSVEEIPGDWFYEEGLRLKALKKEFPSAEDNKLKEASENAIKALEKVIKEFKTSPSKYYAILMLDGDELGKKISGLGIKEQIELSKNIGELGNKTMPSIIHKSSGHPVYSGGDDLLAFLPLEKSISTAFELRKTFSNTLGNGFTCSISLIIVHHQDSLRRALEEARKGMLTAKDKYKRDAIVITLMLSSGTIITGGSKWYLTDSSITFAEFLTAFVSMMTLDDGSLGNQFIYDILKELPAFYDQRERLSKNMLESEVKRLLYRHIPEKSNLRKNSSLLDIIIQSILLLGDMQGLNIDARENLEAILRLSAFCARENIKEI